MQKTTFKVAKMDCPSEEQMIRMKLSNLKNIHALEFDIPNRQLTVFHIEGYETILSELESLNFNSWVVDSVLAEGFSAPRSNPQQERKLLWMVLVINFFFFGLEVVTGFISKSMGLVADSLDMLADSIVYALALFAVGGTMVLKKRIAKAAGYFQLLLAILGFAEAVRRFVGLEAIPEFKTMIVISVLALIGNTLSLYILQKSKSKEAHMQASMIFTSNDIIVNLGVIVAGGLVFWTQSRYPDLVIGSIVFLIVARGAFRILKLSR